MRLIGLADVLIVGLTLASLAAEAQQAATVGGWLGLTIPPSVLGRAQVIE